MPRFAILKIRLILRGYYHEKAHFIYSDNRPFGPICCPRIGMEKTCSSCGWIKSDLTLKDRKWNCSSCGIVHDRDLNAAHNIKSFGLRDQLFLGTGRSEMKPLENTLCDQGSMKEEIQGLKTLG